MALKEHEITGNVGALAEALETLIMMPGKPPAGVKPEDHAKTVENMKNTVRQSLALLLGGLLVDVNRIAAALETLSQPDRYQGK